MTVALRLWAHTVHSPRLRSRTLLLHCITRLESTAVARAPKPITSSRTDDENVSFETIKDHIQPGTFEAITVKPFKFKTMSSVQAAVLSLLPELSRPHDPKETTTGPEAPPPRDIMVKAKTGTGKTLAFLVPAIEARLRMIEQAGQDALKTAGVSSDKALEQRARRAFMHTNVGTLVISPTRELATQIANEALRLTYHHKGFEVQLLVGGNSKRAQIRDWTRGRRDIVVATPGRLRDLLESEPDFKTGISHTQQLILDEADTLLDMGFRDDIEGIKEYLPLTPERQTFLFSATISPAIRQVARTTLAPNHLFINTVTHDASPVHAHVPQYHTVLPSARDQIPYILRLIAHDQLSNIGKSKIILFLPTTRMTQLVSTLLRQLKVNLPGRDQTRVYEIHSKKAQESRSATSDRFRNDKSGGSILVTSDVSARGVDYPGVTRVIQVGIPSSEDVYIHRVGRTGRAGTGGRGDLILLPWEQGFLAWQLQSVPLKPVTVNQLTTQVAELAKAFDESPPVSPPRPASRSRYGDKTPVQIQAPVLPVVEGISDAVESMLPQLDPEAIRETFASNLGYYISRSTELRTTKDVIVDGCKTWSMEALGLDKPPYVSEAFLQRLGYSEGRESRSRRFGSDSGSGYVRRGGAPSWSGRGQQRLKGRDGHEQPAWAGSTGRFGRNDSDERKSGRYGNSRGSDRPEWARNELSSRDEAPHYGSSGRRSRSEPEGGSYTGRQPRSQSNQNGSFSRRRTDDKRGRERGRW